MEEKKREIIYLRKSIPLTTLLKNLVNFTGNSNKKIPNLNEHQKDHSIILDKLISTCPGWF